MKVAWGSQGAIRACAAPNRGTPNVHHDADPAAGRRDDVGRTPSHLRLLARYRFRMVRLLPLRHACPVLRGAVLPAAQRSGSVIVSLCYLPGGLPGPPV